MPKGFEYLSVLDCTLLFSIVSQLAVLFMTTIKRDAFYPEMFWKCRKTTDIKNHTLQFFSSETSPAQFLL